MLRLESRLPDAHRYNPTVSAVYRHATVYLPAKMPSLKRGNSQFNWEHRCFRCSASSRTRLLLRRFIKPVPCPFIKLLPRGFRCFRAVESRNCRKIERKRCRESRENDIEQAEEESAVTPTFSEGIDPIFPKSRLCWPTRQRKSRGRFACRDSRNHGTTTLARNHDSGNSGVPRSASR